VIPVAKQKHFLVSRVIEPELPTDPIEEVEIESVFYRAVQVIACLVTLTADIECRAGQLVCRVKQANAMTSGLLSK